MLNATEEIATIEQDQARLARRLGTSNLMSQLSAEPAIAADPVRLWNMTQVPGRTVLFALARGDSGPLTVDYLQRAGDDRWPRLMVAGAMLLAILAMAVARRRGWLRFDLQWQRCAFCSHDIGGDCCRCVVAVADAADFSHS